MVELVKQSASEEMEFPVVDETGAPVPGLVDGDFTKRIKKAGGSWAAMTVTITETENGWYKMTLSSSHKDTAGLLHINLEPSSGLQVKLQYRVVAALPDDLLALLTAIAGYVDTEIAALATTLSAHTTALAALATAVAAVKLKTDELPANPSDVSDIPTVAAIADAVYDEDDGKLRAHVKTVLKVVTGVGSSATVIQLDETIGINGGAPSSVDNFYSGQVLKFTSGALAGQATSVSSYNGTTKRLTVVELTSAPGTADTAVME